MPYTIFQVCLVLNFFAKLLTSNLAGEIACSLSDQGGGGGSDRLSDDSSKDGNTALGGGGGGGGGFSDSHPETLTDPEFSDNNMGAATQQVTSSPPQSGDELAIQQKHEKKEKVRERERER